VGIDRLSRRGLGQIALPEERFNKASLLDKLAKFLCIPVAVFQEFVDLFKLKKIKGFVFMV
jgi:hypothetical protein